MAGNPEYQFSKLNDILCTSFNNVKHDVHEINTRIENLGQNIANLSSESIKTAFEEQRNLILEQQKALNQLNERLFELEQRPVQQVRHIVEEKPEASMVFPSRESALSEIRKIMKAEKKAKDEPSIYDFPEGEVRITKAQFKSTEKGAKKLNGEWLEITGYGVDMSGWKLHDKGKKHTFTFPEGFMIYGPVKLFTGKGKETNTRLFWGRSTPVWNDKGDVATLKNKRGKIISQISSEPTYSFKVIK
jgi:ElaB/YqjD/DUF883 family membrane-anchored ribosome-binding protein